MKTFFSPFRVGANFLTITALTLPIGMFAQGPNTNIQNNPPSQVQMQNINYYNQIDDNNNSLGNASIINDDENPIQTNLGNDFHQQGNPPAQEQQQFSLGNIFGSNANDNKPCTDCDEVKKAIKISHASSGGSHHRKSFSVKKWGKKISYNTNLKMKKIFAKKYKAKTTFASCFNWS